MWRVSIEAPHTGRHVQSEGVLYGACRLGSLLCLTTMHQCAVLTNRLPCHCDGMLYPIVAEVSSPGASRATRLTVVPQEEQR